MYNKSVDYHFQGSTVMLQFLESEDIFHTEIYPLWEENSLFLAPTATTFAYTEQSPDDFPIHLDKNQWIQDFCPDPQVTEVDSSCVYWDLLEKDEREFLNNGTDGVPIYNATCDATALLDGSIIDEPLAKVCFPVMYAGEPTMVTDTDTAEPMMEQQGRVWNWATNITKGLAKDKVMLVYYYTKDDTGNLGN